MSYPEHPLSLVVEYVHITPADEATLYVYGRAFILWRRSHLESKWEGKTVNRGKWVTFDGDGVI